MNVMLQNTDEFTPFSSPHTDPRPSHESPQTSNLGSFLPTQSRPAVNYIYLNMPQETRIAGLATEQGNAVNQQTFGDVRHATIHHRPGNENYGTFQNHGFHGQRVQRPANWSGNMPYHNQDYFAATTNTAQSQAQHKNTPHTQTRQCFQQTNMGYVSFEQGRFNSDSHQKTLVTNANGCSRMASFPNNCQQVRTPSSGPRVLWLSRMAHNRNSSTSSRFSHPSNISQNYVVLLPNEDETMENQRVFDPAGHKQTGYQGPSLVKEPETAIIPGDSEIVQEVISNGTIEKQIKQRETEREPIYRLNVIQVSSCGQVVDSNSVSSTQEAALNVQQSAQFQESPQQSNCEVTSSNFRVPEPPRMSHKTHSDVKTTSNPVGRTKPVLTLEQWEFINSPQVPTAQAHHDNETEFWVPDPVVWRKEQENRGRTLAQSSDPCHARSVERCDNNLDKKEGVETRVQRYQREACDEILHSIDNVSCHRGMEGLSEATKEPHTSFATKMERCDDIPSFTPSELSSSSVRLIPNADSENDEVATHPVAKQESDSRSTFPVVTSDGSPESDDDRDIEENLVPVILKVYSIEDKTMGGSAAHHTKYIEQERAGVLDSCQEKNGGNYIAESSCTEKSTRQTAVEKLLHEETEKVQKEITPVNIRPLGEVQQAHLRLPSKVEDREMFDEDEMLNETIRRAKKELAQRQKLCKTRQIKVSNATSSYVSLHEYPSNEAAPKIRNSNASSTIVKVQGAGLPKITKCPGVHGGLTSATVHHIVPESNALEINRESKKERLEREVERLGSSGSREISLNKVLSTNKTTGSSVSTVTKRKLDQYKFSGTKFLPNLPHSGKIRRKCSQNSAHFVTKDESEKKSQMRKLPTGYSNLRTDPNWRGFSVKVCGNEKKITLRKFARRRVLSLQQLKSTDASSTSGEKRSKSASDNPVEHITLPRIKTNRDVEKLLERNTSKCDSSPSMPNQPCSILREYNQRSDTALSALTNKNIVGFAKSDHVQKPERGNSNSQSLKNNDVFQENPSTTTLSGQSRCLESPVNYRNRHRDSKRKERLPSFSDISDDDEVDAPFPQKSNKETACAVRNPFENAFKDERLLSILSIHTNSAYTQTSQGNESSLGEQGLNFAQPRYEDKLTLQDIEGGDIAATLPAKCRPRLASKDSVSSPESVTRKCNNGSVAGENVEEMDSGIELTPGPIWHSPSFSLKSTDYVEKSEDLCLPSTSGNAESHNSLNCLAQEEDQSDFEKPIDSDKENKVGGTTASKVVSTTDGYRFSLRSKHESYSTADGWSYQSSFSPEHKGSDLPKLILRKEWKPVDTYVDLDHAPILQNDNSGGSKKNQRSSSVDYFKTVTNVDTESIVANSESASEKVKQVGGLQARLGNWSSKDFFCGKSKFPLNKVTTEYIVTPRKVERERNIFIAMESLSSMGMLTDESLEESNLTNLHEENIQSALSSDIRSTDTDQNKMECENEEENDANSPLQYYGEPLCYSEEDLTREIKAAGTRKMSNADKINDSKTQCQGSFKDQPYTLKGKYRSANGRKVRWFTREKVCLNQCYVKVRKINIKKRTVKVHRCR